LKIFSPFSIFEQLTLALKNRVFPENFNCIDHVLNILFIIQEFWATCACAEKQSCPENFHWIEIFCIIQEFWATCACPENRICSKIFQAGGSSLPLPNHRPGTPMV